MLLFFVLCAACSPALRCRLASEPLRRLMFYSKSDAARALKLNKKNMGSRYIQVFEISLQDWQSATMGVGAHHDLPIAAASVTCHVIKLKGLPFSARQADIVNFFAEGGFYITEMAVVMCASPPSASPPSTFPFSACHMLTLSAPPPNLQIAKSARPAPRRGFS